MTYWPRYLAYECRSCHEDCINPIDLARTKYRECRHCFACPVMDRSFEESQLLPSLRWVTDLDLKFPAFSPSRGPADEHPRASGIPVSERAEAKPAAGPREYGVSCASERFPLRTDGGGDD